MSTLHLRQRLVDIAKRDVGKVEISHNRAPFIAKLWGATDIPNGHQLRYAYCSSGMAYCMREWLKDKEVLAQLQLTPDMAERWRCKTAGAFVWGNTWAPGKIAAYEKEKKLRENPSYKPSPSSIQAATFEANRQVYIINDKKDAEERKPRQRLRVGDIMVFDMSHVGLVTNDVGNIISTIEYNTGASGSREGDGCWAKQRDRKMARWFVRFIDP
jgi:hypothetical protein